jgi:aspartyl-tRNA(Asn)/glutamyl-tRNA(Gln) amidotransferase subunit B
VDEPRLRERFDAIKEKTGDAKRASSLVLTQMTGFLNAQNKTLDEAPKTDALLELADAIAKGTISVNAGKTVLEKMIMTGKNASTIISEEGMGQISDASAIEKFVDEAIAANAEAIASFKAGKASALGAVVGWIMKQSKGQANPAKVQEILQKKIGA